MQRLAISSIALVTLFNGLPAAAATDSTVGAPPIMTVPAADVRGSMPSMAAAPLAKSAPAMSSDTDQKRSQTADYQRPGYGFQLPQNWMTPDRYVDARDYGLDRPARGFGWSRYYDDLVLTDQWGRVYDVADRYDGRSRDGRRGRQTDGLVGGVAGAAVGAVAGNVIAGAGSRLAGSLIGGGVGALAGLAIELAIAKKKRRDSGGYRETRDDGYDGRYARNNGHWSGRYPMQGFAYQGGYAGCDCGGGETVTTTTTTYHGGGGYAVPRQVVTYENVYAPVRAKYRVREAAPTKYRVREQAPAPEGKVRERTKLHTKTL